MALENSLVRVEPGPDGSVEIRDSRNHQLVLRVSDTDFLPESIQRAMDMVAAARATWDDYDGEDLSAFS